MLQLASALAWALFGLSWILAAAWTSRAVKRISWICMVADGSAYLLSFGLLFVPIPHIGRLWSVPTVLGCLLVAAELAAFAFGWWARLHLGKLWSGAITLRRGHRLVTTGPYRLVRHPVYGAFIVAAGAYGLLSATPTALVGAVLLAVHMTSKAIREEHFLRRELGTDQYVAYAAGTPMLVPRLFPEH